MSFWVSDFPTWLQGVGTVAAFGTGLWLLKREFDRDVIAANERALIEAERRAEREQRRREQAEGVTVWLNDLRVPAVKVGQASASDTEIVVSNDSRRAIYDVRVQIASALAVPESQRIATQIAHLSAQGTVPPDSAGRVSMPDLFRTMPATPGSDMDPFVYELELAVRFTDSAGVTWVRYGTTLQEMPNPVW